jgi:thiamine pyrophosphokinase
VKSRVDFSTLLCLNGELPDADFFHGFGGTVIAADGAAMQLLERGVQPHVIVGDMDSFPEHAKTSLDAGITLLHSHEQDTNDFEKIFLLAAPQSHEHVCICGFHGGHLEHTLNNWSVLMRYASKHKLYIYDNGRLAMPVTSQLELHTTPGEIISLIPQPHARLSTHGLHWPLNNEELRLGTREGARNRATGSSVRIEVHDGALLVFFDAVG